MNRLFTVAALVLALVGCSKRDENVLRVGVTSGPHAKIAEYVVEKARLQNVKVSITYFDDFIQPNAALAAGEIDLNIYQHQPFLDEQSASREYKIETVGKAILLPLGIYPGKNIKDFEDLKSGAKVLIPLDPTNGSRALLLLQSAGLLRLKNQKNPTMFDIQENPKNLTIVEVDAPLLPRLLQEDADLAVINADWVIVAGMNPHKALFTEEARNSPYVNVMVARSSDKDDPKIIQFMAFYQADDVRKFIEDTFKGAVIPAW